MPGSFITVVVGESRTPKGKVDPVKDAWVTLSGPGGPYRKQTDAKGYVLFANLPNPDVKLYKATVTHKGQTKEQSGRAIKIVFLVDRSVTITITNEKAGEYEARSYPHDDRDGDGVIELYNVPLYRVLVSGKNSSGQMITYEHKAPRFMPFWNNPKNPEPAYSGRGWINAGLSAPRLIKVKTYKRDYAVHNYVTEGVGAIVMEGKFYIHAGPYNLNFKGYGSAGCVEIVGDWESFKRQIVSLSGIESMPLDSSIEQMVRNGQLFVKIQGAVCPEIRNLYSRKYPEFPSVPIHGGPLPRH